MKALVHGIARAVGIMAVAQLVRPAKKWEVDVVVIIIETPNSDI